MFAVSVQMRAVCETGGCTSPCSVAQCVSVLRHPTCPGCPLSCCAFASARLPPQPPKLCLACLWISQISVCYLNRDLYFHDTFDQRRPACGSTTGCGCLAPAASPSASCSSRMGMHKWFHISNSSVLFGFVPFCLRMNSFVCRGCIAGSLSTAAATTLLPR